MKPIWAAALAALISTGAPQMAAASDDLTLTQPQRNSVWVEGEAARITWQSPGDGALCIELAMGGKGMGLLNECDTPASAGQFSWTIPEGRFTDFGIEPASGVRVMLSWADGHGEAVTSAPFIVAARRPPAVTSYEDAIRSYYTLLTDDPRAAHALLSPFRLTLEAADGARLAYRPRPDFVSWQDSGIDAIARVEVRTIKDVSARMHWAREPEPMLGIRRFSVSLVEILKDGSRQPRNYFIDVARGYLNGTEAETPSFRILSIGTGP